MSKRESPITLNDEVRKALLDAIQQVQDGKEAPGLLRDAKDNRFPDFICTADYIPDGEDGPAYCARVLAEAPNLAAE